MCQKVGAAYFQHSFAASKLSMVNKISDFEKYNFDTVSASAIICSRTSIGPGPFSMLSLNLVSSHMAFIMSYNVSNLHAYILYPSDPCLALGSRYITGLMVQKHWDSVFKSIAGLICQSEVKENFSSELVHSCCFRIFQKLVVY